MQRTEHREKSRYKIDYITYIRVTRDAEYLYVRNKGKPRNSIIFVTSGEMEYTLLKSGNVLKIKKGDLIFIPKDTPYKAKYAKDNTIIRVFTFSTDNDNLPSSLRLPFIKKNIEITKVFESISEEVSNNTLLLTSKIYELLYLITRKTQEVPEAYKKILPALIEIRKNYFENKKLSFYASLCKMSESNFRKLFKEFTGKSFINYRNEIRIREAKKLIESGECTVSEAAYITGFNNMSFFYECYNK